MAERDGSLSGRDNPPSSRGARPPGAGGLGYGSEPVAAGSSGSLDHSLQEPV